MVLAPAVSLSLNHTCERSGGWLVEAASQQALIFLISSPSFALILSLRAREL